jgi:tetratricopeptide (TPR) repeat protein
MPSLVSFRRASVALACALALAPLATRAQPEVPPPPVQNSRLDRELFFQMLRGEMELRNGQFTEGYQSLLEAARRTRDDGLYRRATEAAAQSGPTGGELALQTTQEWRRAMPDSANAVRHQVLILLHLLNRPNDTVEPLRALLRLTPAAERPMVILALPRLFERSPDKQQVAKRLEEILKPAMSAPETRIEAQVALAGAWMSANDPARAFELAKSAHAQDPKAERPAAVALDLMTVLPAAESLVQSHLQARPDSNAVRIYYARVLGASQRHGDAVAQLEAVTKSENAPANAWLTLGGLQFELKHPREATAALTQYLQRVQAAPAPAAAPGAQDDDDVDTDMVTASPERGVTQAYLMLSQAAEQQGDLAGAETWLAKVTDVQRVLDVQMRRASLLARQGKLKEARELVRKAPEKTPEDARNKLFAEVQLLRDARQWDEANSLLAAANRKTPDDPDLLYEQAMMAEKLNRMDEAERLLRRAIEINPRHHHAYNALGYSLAERNTRLPEARDLIKKALELAPGEPFITDSLGWVEYRLGNRDEALRLLQQAYRSRPDVEIGAHLGEVLWISGHRDEALRVLRDAHKRDNTNEVLKETLARLRVDL